MYYITLEQAAKMAGLSEEELATAKKNFEDYIKRAYERGYDDGVCGDYKPDDIGRMVKKVSEDRCPCGNAVSDEHTCPYAEEIDGSSTLCRCCDYCTHQCMMDILTAKQAKELADSKAIDVREVYQEIEDRAKRGEYYCMWYWHLNVMAVMELRANGYVVSDLGNECFKISWE